VPQVWRRWLPKYLNLEDRIMAEVVRNGNGSEIANQDPATNRTVTVTPRVDVLETEHEVLVLADMPGVKADQVDVRFEKGELSLHGRRTRTHSGKESPLREYDATNYYRSFGVSESIAADKISAELKSGILTVRLPKVEAVKPRRIAVKG
jgi:HSP20 family protein